MKRLLCILLVVLIGISCSGCNIHREQSTAEPESNRPGSDGELLSVLLNVPETIDGTFISNSGVSRVTVNANIIFPEIYQVNLYEAIPRVYTSEEIYSFIERHKDEVGWYHINSSIPYTNELPSIDHTSGEVDMYSLWINNIPFEVQFSTNEDGIEQITEQLSESQAENYEYSYFYVSYGLSNRTNRIGFMPNFKYIRSNSIVISDYLLPLTDGRAVDCTISLEEAIALADAEVHAFLPDYEVSAYGQLPLQELGNKSQYYIFQYTRHIDNIPVNDTYGSTSLANDYGYVSGLGVVTVVVSDDGICLLEYYNPYDLGRTVETNVELLPFDTIWDIFSNISLLSIQHLEIYENLQYNAMDVYEIRFGYMTVLQSDGSYLYTPVWDFYATRSLSGTGEYTHANEQEPIYGKSLITINAINGTIIDRNLGY